MKKFGILVCILLPFYCTTVNGQINKGDFWAEMDAHMAASSSKGKEHVEIVYAAGYNVTNRFSIGLSLEDAVSLFKIDGEKDHYMNIVGGAKVAYDVLRDSKFLLNVAGGAGATLDNQKWKYSYYDMSMTLGTPMGRFVPKVGYGFRYYDSMSRFFGNHWQFYASLGCMVRL